MQQKPRTRIATDQPLSIGASIELEGGIAHQLIHVLRAEAGQAVTLFGRAQGEWLATIRDCRKKSVSLQVTAQTRAPVAEPDLWVCFAPIKGGRLETIIEKSTELGAVALQPVITARTIVDKVNAERAESIAREAAEQCERTSWPEIRPVAKFASWLGDFPKDRVLIYGDETGAGEAITTYLAQAEKPEKWAILAGPEGGFTPEELAMLRHKKNAIAVGLGPRILRADTAILTLSALTLAAWGDWEQKPRFEGATA